MFVNADYVAKFPALGPAPIATGTQVNWTDSLGEARTGTVLGYRAAYERALVATSDANIDVATANLHAA